MENSSPVKNEPLDEFVHEPMVMICEPELPDHMGDDEDDSETDMHPSEEQMQIALYRGTDSDQSSVDHSNDISPDQSSFLPHMNLPHSSFMGGNIAELPGHTDDTRPKKRGRPPAPIIFRTNKAFNSSGPNSSHSVSLLSSNQKRNGTNHSILSSSGDLDGSGSGYVHSEEHNASMANGQNWSSFTDLRLRVTEDEIEAATKDANSGDQYAFLRFISFRKGCDNNQRYMYFCTEDTCGGRVFTTKVTLARHVTRDHFGDLKPYHCPNCTFKFYAKRDLDFHVIRHATGAGKHKCLFEGCTFSSNRSGDLKAHLSRHTAAQGRIANRGTLGQAKAITGVGSGDDSGAGLSLVPNQPIPIWALQMGMFEQQNSNSSESAPTTLANNEVQSAIQNAIQSSVLNMGAIERIRANAKSSPTSTSETSLLMSAQSSQDRENGSAPKVSPSCHNNKLLNKNKVAGKSLSSFKGDLHAALGESRLHFVCHKCGPCSSLESIIRHLAPADEDTSSNGHS